MITKGVNDFHQASLQLSTTTQDPQYLPSKYSKIYNTYSRTQIKLIMPFLASISRTCSYSSLYPICKLLKAISKIFMLNQIQVIFLAYLIRETQWDIKDKTIYHNAQNVQDIIYYNNDNLDYKRIILYLMITTFTVKFYLNQNTNDILQQVNKRCLNFKQIFQGWNKKHSSIITKINPRTLNLIYKKLYTNIKYNENDFNMMVDAIIHISPAYNSDKSQQQKKLIQKKDQDLANKKQNFTIKHDNNNNNILFTPNNAVFTSSGFLSMVTLHQQHQNNLQINPNLSGFNPFVATSDRIRQQCLGILGSSVIGGIQPNYDLKQDDDCGELVLGLQDGQSEQNIIFQDKTNLQNNNMITGGSSVVGFHPYMQSHNNQQPSTQQSLYYTSIINLSRRSGYNQILGKDSLGTSQIMLLGGSAISNKNKIQANVINYSVNKNVKDKEQQNQ